MLTRDSILNSNDLPTQEVEVPEWGGSVKVRGLTGKERDEFEQSLINIRGNSATLALSNARAKLVYLGCVDDQGNHLFEKSDVIALGKKSAIALDRLYAVIRDLSGLTEGDVEELTANFTSAPNGDSSSS